MAMTRCPDGTPFAFDDLPADHFPVTLTAFLDGREQMWELVVWPYVAYKIPPAKPEHVGRLWLRIRCANGTEQWRPPYEPFGS